MRTLAWPRRILDKVLQIVACAERVACAVPKYGIDVVIFGGGVAPIIATGLFARFHNNVWIAGYIAGACALSLVFASRIGETSGTDLQKSTPAAGSLAVGSPTVI